MKKELKKINRKNGNGHDGVNSALVDILKKFGYRALAESVRQQKDYSIYNSWRASNLGALFFRHLGSLGGKRVMQEVGWTDRRYLDYLFTEGPDAIRGVARYSRKKLQKAARGDVGKGRDWGVEEGYKWRAVKVRKP